MSEVKPYNDDNESKKGEVRSMFNNIAPKYDLLNHLLSFGIDKLWRKRAIKTIEAIKPTHIIDVATGTGDFAIKAHDMLKCKVTGTDLSAGMLEVAKQKVADKGLSDMISLQEADSEQLPFGDNTFDAVTVAFGVRNYENLDKGLTEMARVIKPGARMVILEFSKPRVFPFKQIYTFYFKHILPMMGGAISHDKKAYEYLPQSVLAFPDGEEFEAHMKVAGIEPVERISQTFGIATIYVGEKR
ncbi:MAG: bifunctional demethylmenaquinone methyltransferase/2-methoxy-6-polyprenyl-1,4-benzoquinol methylase UbiE [Bacteroidales bacterium]|nr:bifunctional demethylmenaquinone methyltransferase/2-methoxy-6-polyprenyl-1,4-benzoquinol methylase UbiE [Bacteroidales bacterium]